MSMTVFAAEDAPLTGESKSETEQTSDIGNGSGDSGSKDNTPAPAESTTEGSGQEDKGASSESSSGSSESGSGSSSEAGSGASESGEPAQPEAPSGASETGSGTSETGSGTSETGSGTSESGSGSSESGTSAQPETPSGSSETGSGTSETGSGSAESGTPSQSETPSGTSESGSGSSESGTPSQPETPSGSSESGAAAQPEATTGSSEAGSGSSEQTPSGSSESGSAASTETVNTDTNNGTQSGTATPSSEPETGSSKDSGTDKTGSGNESSAVTGTGSQEQTDPSNKASETKEDDASNKASSEETKTEDNASTGASQSDSKDTPAAATEASTTKTEEATERRSAAKDETTPAETQEEVNWSNGAVQDVMGIKAETNGDTVTISYKVKHDAEWTRPAGNYPITVTLPDGTTKTIQIGWDYDVHDANGYATIGSINRSSDQKDTEILEISIPASWFGTDEFTVSGGGYTAAVNAGTVTDNDNVGEEAVYTGISIDGDFSDWNAVTKTELAEPTDYNGEVQSVAWRVEEDYVYIYMDSPVGGDGSNPESATWSGTHGNGKFAITTDLGRTLQLQVTQDGAVSGMDDIQVVHNGSQWEIAVPVSSLPKNNGGINFGNYLQDPVLSGTIPGKEVTAQHVDITYDGNYGDWDDVKHTEIEYTTAGTQENVPDGEAAGYSDGDTYFGHCETVLPAHLSGKGHGFTTGVTVAANYNPSTPYDYPKDSIQMRLATVDSNGNINWNPQKEGLENGTYEYYIFDISCWGSSQNINELYDADVMYGKATITLTDTKQDMEWYIDMNKYANKIGLSANDIKTVSTQYINIGDEWVTTAGTSTGPVGSVVLIAASASAPFLKKSKFVLDILSKFKIG